MKSIDIALKDIMRSFRSLIALVFMFGVPIGLTGIFYLAFGGMQSEDGGGFDLPVTTVAVFNADEGSPYFNSEDFQQGGDENDPDFSGSANMGDVILSILQVDQMQDFFIFNQYETEAAARQAVDEKEAGAALIIPADFTQNAFSSDREIVLSIYQDPELTIGPAVLKGILSQFVESFAGARIMIEAVSDQLAEQDLSLTDADVQMIVAQFIGSSESEQGKLYTLITPAGAETSASQDTFTLMISYIMGGMMVFYAFYTTTAAAESILREEEEGTLQRLFTTPTSVSTILTGKFISIALQVFMQLVILLVFSNLVFGINWGDLTYLFVFVLTATAVSSGFGIFLISMIKNTKQAGVLYGGVVTICGMMGLLPVFTMGATSSTTFVDSITLLVPQGWTMQILQSIMEGKSVETIWFNVGITLVWAVVFFLIGHNRLQKRFK